MRVLGVDPGLARTGVAIVEGMPGHLVLIHAACIETVPQTNEARATCDALRLGRRRLRLVATGGRSG